MLALLLLIFTFVCKNSSSRRQKFPGKNYRQMFGKSETSDQENFSTGTRRRICQSGFLCCVALVFNSLSFFRNGCLTENYSTLISSAYKHLRTRQDGSKTVIRSI